MIFGAIVAGGNGSRMQKDCVIGIDKSLPDIPKQFLELCKRPMICLSVEKFLSANIDRLIIGVHSDYIDYTNGIIKRYFADRADDITVVEGGDTRNGTVMNIIDEIYRLYGEDERHCIITHDAARPFVTTEMIEENIALVQKYGAVDTVCPAVDTVAVSDGEYIADIPDRSRLYYGQTPQSFNIAKLKRHYMSLGESERRTLTDCCKIFHLCGERVYLAKGDSLNMKVTTKNDYFVAQAIANMLEN